jgi:hypothetical protein
MGSICRTGKSEGRKPDKKLESEKTRVYAQKPRLKKNAVQEIHLNTQPPTGVSHGVYSVCKIADVRATKQSGPFSYVICRGTNPDRSSSSISLSGIFLIVTFPLLLEIVK